ncbi:hypothetical protein SERLADRAFT_407768 [Serpula lacrymans var. lacrymans S7.9]|uniref:Uncharacterized protein n=1 Tax=Serpula lacrymans var. lacrymans (strain S7.9) TaxID=578457 RepID=F8NV79_SERL9|nr:uncharacterized protein SERLADRAFT_407768 [Serpula lacrymans var. lacrymans S7.9]EGO25341.1 hypothetical protein SERLADRAFT_407768 [Serpula lacrymans var. lacrymans S7.9]
MPTETSNECHLQLNAKVPTGSLYYPWQSKAHFLTAILFGSARVPFSEQQKSAVLSRAKKLGAQDVPVMNAVKTTRDAIAKDYSNPLICYWMQDFPEDAGEGMSETWHGDKSLKEGRSPPAARVGDNHFFMGSYSLAKDGLKHNPAKAKELYALGRAVEKTEAGFIVNWTVDLQTNPVAESSKKYATLAPHPLCKKADDRMGTSQNSGLFPTCSTHGTDASHETINCPSCKNWHCCLGLTKEYKESEVGYNSIFVSGEARTPEHTAAEISKQFELAFKPGATEKIKAATASTGISDKTTVKIIDTLVELGKKLCKHPPGSSAMSESDIRAAQEKLLGEMLPGADFGAIINPLLGMDNLNIHLDTPTEILHTVLLGVVKYFWGQTIFLLDKAKTLDTFHRRLDSFDKEGLNVPSMSADYIC